MHVYMAATRRTLIAGNWKMNLLRDEAYALMGGILQETTVYGGVDILICPPFIYLEIAVHMMKNAPLFVGAQNLYYEKGGPYTGEISAAMLKEIGCSYVIIGHSERRTLFHEGNREINRKLKACLDLGLIPILCIGETLVQRNSGKTFDTLREQLTYGLQGIAGSSVRALVIAYEPVWAIGTGISAESSQVEEVHVFIRDTVSNFADEESADAVRIIYGGSVNPANAHQLLSCPNVDGALVGGASLKLDAFCGIVGAAESCTKQTETLSRG
jgi:triosephosphate isomerase